LIGTSIRPALEAFARNGFFVLGCNSRRTRWMRNSTKNRYRGVICKTRAAVGVKPGFTSLMKRDNKEVNGSSKKLRLDSAVPRVVLTNRSTHWFHPIWRAEASLCGGQHQVRETEATALLCAADGANGVQNNRAQECRTYRTDSEAAGRKLPYTEAASFGRELCRNILAPKDPQTCSLKNWKRQSG